MLHNTLQVNATQMAPERRGAAVSAFASSFFMGQSLGVSLAGAAVVSTGTAPLLVIGALGVLAVAFYFAALLQRRQPQS
jgi:predicted MFS family arabinose efflux permease